MKVKELIAELKNLDPELDVFLSVEDPYKQGRNINPTTTVYEYEFQINNNWKYINMDSCCIIDSLNPFTEILI